MKFVSEYTGKSYNTAEECLAADAEYEKIIAEKKAAAKKVAEEKDARFAEVQAAYEEATEACRRFKKLKLACVKDYGKCEIRYSSEDIADPFWFFGPLVR